MAERYEHPLTRPARGRELRSRLALDGGMGRPALRADPAAPLGLVLALGRVGEGSKGGYSYCLAFLVMGTVLWAAGTVW